MSESFLESARTRLSDVVLLEFDSSTITSSIKTWFIKQKEKKFYEKHQKPLHTLMDTIQASRELPDKAALARVSPNTCLSVMNVADGYSFITETEIEQEDKVYTTHIILARNGNVGSITKTVSNLYDQEQSYVVVTDSDAQMTEIIQLHNMLNSADVEAQLIQSIKN